MSQALFKLKGLINACYKTAPPKNQCLQDCSTTHYSADFKCFSTPGPLIFH